MDNTKITLPIEELERRFKSVAGTLPILVGNEVVNFALDNFKKQGFLGASFQSWNARKNPNAWGQKPKRNGRALLVDSGRLRGSIRVLRTSWDAVVVGSDVPYAKAHNEGLRVGQIQSVKEFERKVKGKVQTVRAFTRHINQDIPQRQFLGDSPYLRERLQRIIGTEILKAFRK